MEPRVREGETSAVKLNLGAGTRPIEGAVNVDIIQGSGIELVCDLNGPWPWAESSVDLIIAEDCFEHLYPLGKAEGQANIIEIIRRCWAILKPGGILHVQVPSTESRAAFQDPTHVTYWNINTFRYFLYKTSHWYAYKGFVTPAIRFKLGDECYIKSTPPDLTGAAWVHARMEAIKL